MATKTVGDQSELVPCVHSLHDKYVSIIQTCEEWNKKEPIVGLHRYTSSLLAEKQFLEKLLENPSLIKKEHIQSTNLGYLEPVFEALSVVEKKNEVMKLVGVPLSENSHWMPQTELIKRRSIKVDIVADNGLTWIKVIARNAKAFRHEVMGLEQAWEESDSSEEEDMSTAENSFEYLPIFKKAHEYLTTAKVNQVHFCTPKVVFAFMRIPANTDAYVEKIMDRLKEMGIVVYLQTPESSLSSICEPKARYENLTTDKVLLDVSSIFALTSELSHHPCLPEKISALPIQVQAERETSFPCLMQMKALIEGKQLCMIHSAFDRLQEIVKVVGGPREKARFEYLFRGALGSDIIYEPELWTLLPPLKVEVIHDAPLPDFFQLLEPPLQKSKLNNGRKIRTQFSPFHALLFGSGGYYRMSMFTAIQWMEKALEDAGVQGQFIICHEPRSLAEQKMQK